MLLIKPYLGCNINCSYCYERLLRATQRPEKNYDLDAILKRMEEWGSGNIALHGGEILTLPKKDVEKLLAKSYKLQGCSSIQTNATLIDDDYKALFKKYKTNIGISWDGPDELSEFRPGTRKVGATIEQLVAEKFSVSIIIVVSRANAGTEERLKKLEKYLLHLNDLKVFGRLNPCLGAPQYELSMERLIAVYLELAGFIIKNNLPRWSPFSDIALGLQGRPRVCFLEGCDPFSTSSATPVLNDGSFTNCMRTNKEGIILRHPVSYKTRDEILSHVPQSSGGCKGCRYWQSCHGGCPSGTIGNDWRNRTYLCPMWKALFKYFESCMNLLQIKTILDSDMTICPVNTGQPPGNTPHGDAPHGDHSDAMHVDYSDSRTVTPSGHGDSNHNDHTHGDSSHTDQETHLDHSDNIKPS